MVTTPEAITLGTAVISALITLGGVANTIISAQRNDHTTRLIEFEATFRTLKEKLELETQLRVQAEKDVAATAAKFELYQEEAIEDKHRWDFERERFLDQLMELKKEDPPNDKPLPKPV
jgi:hypothetical protein